MAIFTNQAIGFKTDPPIDTNTKVVLSVNHFSLLQQGFNIPVEILTASAFRKPGNIKENLKSQIITAHFDTGASKTSIDSRLAQELDLMPTGIGYCHTAAGVAKTPNFVIDLHFPNTMLSPFHNLQISSCMLPYNPKIEMSPQNFGLLLGRDIMSKWNIVWNGPTSTVIISD